MKTAIDAQYYVLFFICLVSGLLVQSFRKLLKTEKTIQLPPSPLALPIIGHLHLLSSILHQSFQNLAFRYGPLMLIRAGSTASYVVSNAAVAEEVFKTHDINFASRPEFGSSDYQIYKDTLFSTLGYGKYWIFMKKICMMELLSAAQINRFTDVRKQEMVKLLEILFKRSDEGEACDVGIELMSMTNNMICRLTMSTRCSGNVNEGIEIREIAKGITLLSGKLSLVEVFGPLKKKKVKTLLLRYDKLLDGIITEHEKKTHSGESKRKDMLDILLDISDDQNTEVKLSKNGIKGFFLDLFLGGTDTTSVALQWALAELLNHPDVLKKLTQEINKVVGSSRLVEESDVQNLPYLQAVIKETLRMHPSLPLVFRKCREDCEINGYIVPKDSRLVVNLYAINRDPNVWNHPNAFVPDRFTVSSMDKYAIQHHNPENVKGQRFDYVPFGGGRRGCPGSGLAAAVMHVTLAALVQCFDWKLKGALKVDMEEGAGFSAALAHPLICYPVIRVNPSIITCAFD